MGFAWVLGYVPPTFPACFGVPHSRAGVTFRSWLATFRPALAFPYSRAGLRCAQHPRRNEKLKLATYANHYF